MTKQLRTIKYFKIPSKTFQNVSSAISTQYNIKLQKRIFYWIFYWIYVAKRKRNIIFAPHL